MESPAAQAKEEEDTKITIDDDGTMWGEDELGRYRIDNRVWTMNEIRDHPLFMTDVPSDPRDVENYPLLTALQSVLYDDQTPEELAEHFRKQGNEAMKFQASRIALQNALTFYTRGLEMECKDAKLNAVLHSNRAAVGLKLGENLKVVDDCRCAVRLDPQNLKAWFRGAQASEALGLAEQGLTFCRGALRVEPKEPEVLRIQRQLQVLLEKQKKAQQEMRLGDAKLKDAMQASASAVQNALELRGSRLGPALFDLAMYRMANGGITPHPKLMDTEEGATIEWPLLLLYDEVNQSDFVAAFDERCALQEQLQLMFPEDRNVEWDAQGKYVWHQLAVYLEYYPEGSAETSMFKIDCSVATVTLLTDRCLPPCLVLHVLVDGSPAQAAFVKENRIE
mmetsp:Transcript_41655/g.93273  ORF Transcript_41655/g.93273 Transcript_41655/m.93273 type:complete len:393 (+) Transcript_41655:62-1240(+)